MNIKKSFLKYKLFLLLISFTSLINIFLLQLPLFKEFSYEYSVVNSLLLFLIIPILVLYSKKRNKNSITIKKQVVALIIAPLLIALIKFIFFEICSLIDGVIFYFVITFISGILSYLLSEIVYFINPRRSYIIYFIALLILISIPLIELYLYPQIYFYSPLIGFFPGSIYDEDISVDTKLVIYRLLNVLLFFSFYWITTNNSLKKLDIITKKRVLSVILLLSLVISFFLSPILGFSTNEARLKNKLSNKIVTEKFTIYYGELDSLEQKVLTLHFEFYFSELQKSLKVKPSKKITAFIFDNDEDKRKYFGSGNADVAKPWLYQVYLDKSSWKSTLKHELAHIFSAEFGSTFLKLAGGFNPFLIEGLATSQDPYVNLYSIDYLAALHFRYSNRDIITEIKKSLNFFSFNSTISYVYSGSFSKFLIDNYGIANYKLFYSTNDFENIYQQKFQKVLDDYKNYLNTYSQESNQHIYYYYFGRKSLIQKDCPRFIEKKIKEGWNYFNDGEILKAKDVFNNILNHSENYSALIGKAECLIKQDSLNRAEQLLNDYIPKFSKTPYEYLLKFRLADVFAQLDKINKALDIYSQLEVNNPNYDLKYLSNLRIKLLSEGQLKNYLSANDSIKMKILLQLNKESYIYSSIPSIINLAKNLNLTFEQFLQIFDKAFVQYDEYSSYAFLKLSEFMVDNYDLTKARKMAALAKRLNTNENFNPFLNENYKMIEWFYFRTRIFQ